MVPLAVIAQNFMSSGLALQSRFAAQKLPKAQWSITLWMFILLCVGGIGYAVVRGDIQFSALSDPKLILLFCTNGFLFGVSTGLLYYAYSKLDAAVIQIVSSIRIPLVAFLSVLFLSQKLTMRATFGVILVFMSVLMVVKRSDMKHTYSRKALLIVILVTAMTSIGIITEKITLNSVNVSSFMAFSWPMELAWVYAASLFFTKHLGIPTTVPILKSALPLGVTRLFGGFLFVWLLENVSNTSFVGAMSGISVVLTALLAAIFLKETKRLGLYMCASMLCFCGVILVYI